MNRLMSCSAFFLLAAVAGLCAQGAPAPEPVRAAVECTPRGGLPNVFAKLKTGEPVKVAFLGGSITEQRGWRVLSLKWLRERYPSAKIEEINAAIGGTGSDLGVYRLEKDVLRFKPDLLFVEFAVNDGGTPSEKIRKAMEGIVRKTWAADPRCDICFVYTLVTASFPALQEGRLTRAASIMEDVADHYQIPSVHLGMQAAALAKDGKLIPASPDARVEQVAGNGLNESTPVPTDAQGRIIFSKDGVHPFTDTGHVLYTQALIRALTQMESMGTPGQHAQVAPLDAGNWEHASFAAINDAAAIRRGASDRDVSPDPVAARFANRLPGLMKLRPGDSLDFRFQGSDAFLYCVRGPDSGVIEILVDGSSRKVVNFDRYCGTHRLVTIPVGENLPDQVHTVTVRVLDDPVAKGEILAGKGLEDWKAHPGIFTGSDWYVGAILVLGKAVH
ncbi:MAG: hypothetical protein BGO12_08295 [Verrucomicrobia bacterium 61-8]|nr:MAG: hypothetical protein BGO12_08295 [Verrucomicrobia bacterium 61-8]